ncbi:molecular chaperone HtpG [Clostridium sartagoforme]|uniref:Molecular chaperone HtpG n=1 Tax=Clostridium sartagoforme TaxID=84031 RepID=A0A4S2DQM5_9CLOT|nr:molecular chaperone HtpG [Clostridium sartagoforme]TGY44515.1 molecular chaperone HtpG [Clostridium sartagoforme]
MEKNKGNISIHTENIFPIIKKWLYSDKDIFIRELISNGCDAISKYKRLVSLGEAKEDADNKYSVTVSINKSEKTLKFIDNGIGMTEEEVKKYINQVAFSGAEDFINKYKDQINDDKDIIGHFGLGFYSAFMVAKRVQIDTLSYIDDAEAVTWVCEGGTEYEISPSLERKTRGTTITLFVDDDSTDFLEVYKVREIIEKYCSFLPIEIYLEDENSENKEEDKKPLNDTNPLWMKAPKDCTDEEYKAFYKKVFRDFNDPLFWIHLNVDYPFNLKGILYFPKLKHELEATEGQVKLYNNQVFVADNIKEVIPDFLLLLKGTIDCPDLPLNVSRSFLQKDKDVMKISKHIVKKVADKLVGLSKNEKESFNNFWKDIQIFIKYGCLRDESFYEKIKDIVIFRRLNGEYITLKEYLENNKEKHENKVFYVTDEKQQSQYIKMFKDADLDALVLDCSLDNHFISFLEAKEPGVTFARIDSDISDILKEENNEDTSDFNKKIEDTFKELNIKDIKEVKVQGLKNTETPAIILVSEESRRMLEMSKMFGGMDMPNMFNEEKTLVLNSNNPIIKKIASSNNDDNKEKLQLISNYIVDIALLSNKELTAEEMNSFIDRSNKLLSMVIEL